MFWFLSLLFIIGLGKAIIVIKDTISMSKNKTVMAEKEEKRVITLLANQGIKKENLISGLCFNIGKTPYRASHIIRGVDKIWLLDTVNLSGKIQYTNTGELKQKTPQSFRKLSCLIEASRKAKFLSSAVSVPVMSLVLINGKPTWETKFPDSFVFETPLEGQKTLSWFSKVIAIPSGQKPISVTNLDRAWKKLKDWERKEQHKIVYISQLALQYVKPAKYWLVGIIVLAICLIWLHKYPDAINNLMLRAGLADKSILEIIKGVPAP